MIVCPSTGSNCRECSRAALCQREHATRATQALTYVRKLEDGKLLYVLVLGQTTNELTFDAHGDAFDFAVEHQLELIHQPWSIEIDDRIRQHLSKGGLR